jgi:hypothetical protein
MIQYSAPGEPPAWLKLLDDPTLSDQRNQIRSPPSRLPITTLVRIRNRPRLAFVPPINPPTLPPRIPRNTHAIQLLEADIPRQPLRRITAPLNTDTSRSDLFRQVGGGAGHHETRVLVARAAVQFDRALDVWGAGEAGGFAPLGGGDAYVAGCFIAAPDGSSGRGGGEGECGC